MVDAVLLEWEDVLAGTRVARRDALRHALAAEGIAHTVADDDGQLRGLGATAAVRAVLRHMGSADETLAALLAMRASRAFAETLAGGLVLMPDAVAFVRRMQVRSRVAIVTRASRAETDAALGMSGLLDAFTTVVTADDIAEDAPASSAYQCALSRLARVRAVEPGRAVAVVDALPAIRAARASGVRVLAVRAPAHEAMEADMLVETLDGVQPDDLLLPAGPAKGGRSA